MRVYAGEGKGSEGRKNQFTRAKMPATCRDVVARHQDWKLGNYTSKSYP